MYEQFYRFDSEVQKMLDPYLKRWSPYVLKLAMLIQPFIDPNSNEISGDAILSGVSIVEYAIQSTTFLFRNELGETAHRKKQRQVLEFIAKRGGKVTWGQLLRSHRLDGGKKDYAYVVETLVESGQLVEQKASLKMDWTYTLGDHEVEKVGKS